MSKELKATPLSEMIDRHIGKVGTPARDAFERKIKAGLLRRQKNKKKQTRRVAA